jgi:hypothetical protein
VEFPYYSVGFEVIESLETRDFRISIQIAERNQDEFEWVNSKTKNLNTEFAIARRFYT